MASADPARVLRVPGTRNCKPAYTPPRPVRVELFEPDRRYNPSEFDDWLPELPTALASTSESVDLSEPIRDGGRNDTLYELGRGLNLKRLDADTIASTLRTLNRDRCDPPLPDGERADIIKQVTTQPRRPDFDRHTRSALPTPPWPEPLSDAAYHGPIGQLVQLINGTAHRSCTAFARKGTAWAAVRRVYEQVDRVWAFGDPDQPNMKPRVATGLSSGEGVIHAVRDPHQTHGQNWRHGGRRRGRPR